MNVGGPAHQVVNLIDGLDPSRFEHRVLAGTVEPDEADELELRARHVSVERVPGLGRSPNPLSDVLALRRLRSAVRQFRPHIVHTHTAKAGVVGRLATWSARTGPATVHTFHGHLLRGYFSPRVSAVVTATEKLLASRTTRLVAVGERVRDELLAVGVGRPDQWVVVPPGVRIRDLPDRAAARRDLGVGADAFVIAFVGRLTTVKRPDRLAEVAEILADRGVDFTLLVAGEGALFDELRSRVAPLGERVRLLGWRPDVENVWAAADLALLTSDNEGMPVSLIEAALAGVPAVTTDVGSAREVVVDGETGLVVPPQAVALADVVARLQADRGLLARMSRAASERAEREFSAERLVQDTSALYEALVRHGTD